MTARRFLLGGFLGLALAFAGLVQAQDRHAGYRLGAGDAIHISVFQNPDLTLDTQVGGDGRITYPLIGVVKVGGLTIEGAERAIAHALEAGGYMKHPQVNILVTQIRSHQVSVLGEVNKPGRYPLETFGTRLSAIIATAGGIAPGGADVVILTGERDGRRFRREIDFPSLFLHDDLKDDVVVSGGDVIYVPRAPMFYIYGEVQRPGSYRIRRGMTIREALVEGGGPSARGNEKDLHVYRRGPDGKVTVLTPGLDTPVRPQDVLRVGESLF